MSENGRKKIELPSSITVRELAAKVQSSPIQVIKILMSNGVMANINQQIDFDTAAIVASEFGFDVNIEAEVLEETKDSGEIPLWRQVIASEDPKHLAPRPRTAHRPPAQSAAGRV